jgi:signal transduction histidine kinase
MGAAEHWARLVRRIAGVPHGPALAVGALALAGLGQAIALGVAFARFAAPGVTLSSGSTTVLDTVPLCLLALAATVPLIFLRPGAAAAAITVANVLLLVTFGTPTVAALAAQVIASYRLGAAVDFGRVRVGWVAGSPYAGAVLAVPFVVLALTSHGSVAAVLLAALVPAAAGTGVALRARRVARDRAADRAALAETLSAHLARGERARIARELHDVVAHHISMISVQAETARLTTPGLPAAGVQRFAEIGDTARAGLTEMRRLLGVLREDAAAEVADRHPQPGLAQLAELIDAARETSGTGTRLIVSGPVTAFDPGVELAAYRIVQEALTNARRHAPGAAVDVELRYEGHDELRLRIRDNGPGPRHAANSGWTGGHGLLGMRERAAAVGGSVTTRTATGGGFLVEAVLPAPLEAAYWPATDRAETAGTAGHRPASEAQAAGTRAR